MPPEPPRYAVAMLTLLALVGAAGCKDGTSPTTTPTTPTMAPAPEPDIRAHCLNGYGEIQNIRIVDQGRNWVTYAWDPDVCLDHFDAILRKVYDVSEGGTTWHGFVREIAVRVDEPKATFRGVKDGVYGPSIHRPGWLEKELGPYVDPNDYRLGGSNDPQGYDYPVRYERWEDTDFVCHSGLENEAMNFGSILLQEWNRGQRQFVVNVEDELDQASDFDADLVLAEVEDMADRFRDVMGFPLLKAGEVIPPGDRREGEIRIGYGQYPDRSADWAPFVKAFATVWDGRVTLTGSVSPGDPPRTGRNLERGLSTLDQTLIHEVFHLWGFRHANLGFIAIGFVPPSSDTGVPMTPEMTAGVVDTRLDFEVLRCLIDR